MQRWHTHLCPLVKVNSTYNRVNLVVSALLVQSPGDTVQTGTGKVDPARKFKCTTAARVRRTLLKATHTKERSVHTNSESCNIQIRS